jgi:CBS domain-containing protein
MPTSAAPFAPADTYEQDSVGRLMEQPIAVFPPHLTVGEATEQIRDLATSRLFTYGYITDATGILLGVVTMRDLLLHQKADKLEDFMLRQPFSLRPEMDLMEAMRQTVNKHYPSYPVCDGKDVLIGIVRGSRIFEQQAIEISAQAGAMVGVEKEERMSTPFRRSLRFRHPWLQFNLLTAFVAAGVVGFFEGTIERIVVLAVFLPVLAGQSGNTGCQAMAVALRGLTLGELKPGDARRHVFKEGMLGLANGALGRPERGHRHVHLRQHQAHARVAARAERHRPARHDRQLFSQRPLRRVGPGHLEKTRLRSGHGLQHLPDHGNRRSKHGPFSRPRHLVAGVSGKVKSEGERAMADLHNTANKLKGVCLQDCPGRSVCC